MAKPNSMPDELESGLTFEELQEDRKQYVKNIEIEYKYGCYEEKQPESCQLLGEFMEAIKQDFKEAFKLFDGNCAKHQHPRSCYKVGAYLVTGRESQGGYEKAVKSLNISCNASEKPVVRACRLLGTMHWNGSEGREPQSKLAEQCMKRACDLNDYEACWMLSTWYMGLTAGKEVTNSDGQKIRKGRLERDMDKALEYGIKACESNVFQSCANVARIYHLGDGVPKDPAKAKEFKKKTQDILDGIKYGLGAGFTG